MSNKYISLIQQFRDGGQLLREVLVGYPEYRYNTPTAPGQWSMKELVVHLADSDAIAIDRMKRIITEENPSLLWADDKAYVSRLHSQSQSMEDALILFEVGRRQFARVLEQFDDSDFARIGTHNKAGVLTLEGLISTYINHLEHHLKFAHGKRKTLGV